VTKEASMDDELQGIFAAAHERAVKQRLPYFGAVLPSEAHAVMNASPEAQLIDVRTRPEWDYVGHVPESSLLEWNVYPDGRRNPQFLEQLRLKAPDLDAPLLFLCRSGQRSDGAARVAAAAGYSKAFNVLEGFEGARDGEGHRGQLGGWRKAGLPWVQG
jgi:rhodanese-related sulfurtransferase